MSLGQSYDNHERERRPLDFFEVPYVRLVRLCGEIREVSAVRAACGDNARKRTNRTKTHEPHEMREPIVKYIGGSAILRGETKNRVIPLIPDECCWQFGDLPWQFGDLQSLLPIRYEPDYVR